MARIRTIKPEFPEDETLGAVSRDARLLFILLWTRCDDHGRFRAAPALLRSTLYPYDEDLAPQNVAGWIAELNDAGRVLLYEVDGQAYGQVVNWGKHQRVDNAGKAMYPAPPEPPPSSAVRRGSPLDLDQDQEGTTTTTGPSDPTPQPAPATGEPSDEWWSSVWDSYAERCFRQRRNSGTNIANPTSWKRTVRRQGRLEQSARARELVGQFDLTAGQVAAVLTGEDGILRTATRKAAS